MKDSRRNFLKKTAGLGAIFSLAGPGVFATNNTPTEKFLAIHPRYYRWYPDGDEEWLETNTDYATLEWEIPLSQVAVVLVDVWQRHYIRETEERTEKIINEKLIPLLKECRKNGLQIIHAPSPGVARTHPNWVHLIKDTEIPMARKAEDWPPADFRNSTGAYSKYSKIFEPREAERQKLPALTFHPGIVPVGNEAVIATGEELHRYCKQKKILFLLYAGFNTNACLITRDYGMLQMSNDRGYKAVLIRDCTTAMESKDTQATLAQTKGAILFFEMFGQYSVTSDDIINGIT